MTQERQNAQNSPAQNDASQSKQTNSFKDRLQGKKSNAKRIGVKSVLSYGDRSLAITQFGRGNSADIVFNAPNGGRDEKVPDQYGNFTIQQIDKNIDILGGMNHEALESMLHNPAEEVAEDKLKLKGTLEQEFFGAELEKSNIHIQLIHNILDIQKLLGLYINDVLYAVDNLKVDSVKATQKKFSEYDRNKLTKDFLGSKIKPEDLPKLKPFLGFFGDAFITSNNRGNALTQDQQDQYNVNVLKTLEALRHWTAHYGENEQTHMNRNEEYPFFDSSKSGNDLLTGTEGDWSVVDDNFKNRIDRINNSFLENSVLNVKKLWALLNLRNETDKKALVQDYYKFSIIKEGKNLGLSIVKLREKMFENSFPKIKTDICNNHRSKINTITDYLIYRHLKERPEMVAYAIKKLQESINTLEKNKVYKILAKKLWKQMQNVLTPFFNESCVEDPEYTRDFNKTKIIKLNSIDRIVIKKNCFKNNKPSNISAAKIKGIYLKEGFPVNFVDGFNFNNSVPSELIESVRLKKDISDEVFNEIKNSCKIPLECVEKVTVRVLIPSAWIEDVKIRTDNGIPFVKLLSFLCSFMEGKEINELLTAYIHKFENIQSFIDTLIELDQPIRFTQPYSAFNTMGNQYAGEVARQLRVLASIGKMKPDLSSIQKPLYFAAIQTIGATDEQVTDDFFKENFEPDRTNKKEYKEKKVKTNPFRNFVINNVIKSPRFLFLARFSKPKTVRALMNNAKIVRYTLSRLPVEQVDLYYKRSILSENPNDNCEEKTREEKLDALTAILTGMEFQKVLDKKDSIVNKNDAENIERLKAQINLYLTVAYVAIKQLVKINARYYIAYQILERDTELTLRKTANDPKPISNYFKRYTHKDKQGNEVEEIVKCFGLIEYFIAMDDDRYKEIEQWKPTDEKWKPAEKKAWFEHVRRVKKEQHLNNAWRLRFHRDIKESLDISNTGFLQVAVRIMTAHLYILSLVESYVEQFRKDTDKPMQSYYELFHYLIQSELFNAKEVNLKDFGFGINEKKHFNYIEKGIPDDRLIKVSYVPFGYNLARYQNLTIEALFDEDCVYGQKRLARLCYKEAFNRIATAKRRGKPNNVIDSLKSAFIEQYNSKEEAYKAVRLGERWGFEDKARQAGLNGEPFPESLKTDMANQKYSDEEIAHVQRAYDAAKRKSEN